MIEKQKGGRPQLSTETPTVKIEITLPVALRDKLDRLTNNRSAWVRAQIEQVKEQDMIMLTPELQAVLDILKREPIRAIDGRYSDGFADTNAAQVLVHMDKACIQDAGGYAFFCIVQP